MSDGPADVDDQEPGLGLDEVLEALRHDLTAARDATGAREADAYGLGVREVEIELSVEVARRRSADGGLGVKWFVLSGDARARAERDRTEAHRIRLTLGPLPPASGSAEPAEPWAGPRGVPGGADQASAGGETIGPKIAEDR